MSEKSIFIKNMVCDRCVLVVREVVKNLGLDLQFIDMGKVVLAEVLTFEQAAQLERKLSVLGFELIQDKRSQLIEDIKICMIGFVNKSSAYDNTNLSEYLSNELNYDYNYLSGVFSAAEKTSIEKYLIRIKVEKVKELMFVEKLSLTEIAFELGYSSLAHLSSQFKKVTGCSPSYYRDFNDTNSRQALDKIKIA